MEKILIVEDEEHILMALEDDFKLEGYQVTTSSDGNKGLELGMKNEYHAIILDVMLPGINGFEICKKLRQANKNTPIIMLTAKGQEVDKILGLELGADDYITKPFSPRELQSRVRAVIRRTNLKTVQNEPNVVKVNDLEIDFNKFEILKNNEKINLTSQEFLILKYLVHNNNKILSRMDIMDEVWGEEILVSSRTVDTHIAKLRAKLEDDPHHPVLIKSLRNLGYMFIGECSS